MLIMEVYLKMSGCILQTSYYQTLPLYSNLQTTGVYIYATDIRTKSREAIINAESEIRNEYDAPLSVNYEVSVYDYDDKLVSTFRGEPMIVNPKTTAIVKASQKLDNLHFLELGIWLSL